MGYDQWLEAPYTGQPDTSSMEEAYDEYITEMRETSDRAFSAGGHEYTDPEEFFRDGCDPMPFDEYMERRLEAEHDDALLARAEARADTERRYDY